MPKPDFFKYNYSLLLLILSLTLTFVGAKTQAQILETSNLPIIIIDTPSTIPDEPKIYGTMGIIDNANQVNNVSDPYNNYDGNMGIELRGSSSQALFPKKNYGFELRTINNEDTSVSIVGMPAEEDWVLHGPYSDKTMMRNYITFKLFSYTGRYSSRTRFVEVIENDDYQGLYLMLEKIKRDSNRVDIAKLKVDETSGDDLTGGYIIKIDKEDGSNSNGLWESPYEPLPGKQIRFQYEYPDGDEIAEEQKAYIEEYITDFETALKFSSSFDTNGYPNYIDEDSFVDFALINELTKNIDGYRLSTFMYKDKDSKGGNLTLGPIWDFNLAIGNAGYCGGETTDGWAWDFNRACPDDYWLIPFWWDKLMSHPRFVDKMNSRWQELRSGPWSDENIVHLIDSTRTEIQPAVDRNYERWPDVLGQWIWPNYFVGNNYDQEITYFSNWLTDRANYIDVNLAERLSVVAGLEQEVNNEDLSIYPNPFNARIHLESKLAFRSIEIFDTEGRLMLVLEESKANAMDINTDGLLKGVYFMHLNTIQGEQMVRKLVKL